MLKLQDSVIHGRNRRTLFYFEGKPVTLTFVERLWLALHVSPSQGPLRWSDDGRTFILDGDDFNKRALSLYKPLMTTGKVQSLVRNLYRYGFHLSKTDGDPSRQNTGVSRIYICFHPQFSKREPVLLRIVSPQTYTYMMSVASVLSAKVAAGVEPSVALTECLVGDDYDDDCHYHGEARGGQECLDGESKPAIRQAQMSYQVPVHTTDDSCYWPVSKKRKTDSLGSNPKVASSTGLLSPMALLSASSIPPTALPYIGLPSTVIPPTAIPSTSLPSAFLPTSILPSTSLSSTALPSNSLQSTNLTSTALPSTALLSTPLPSNDLSSAVHPSTTLPYTSLSSTSLPSALPSTAIHPDSSSIPLQPIVFKKNDDFSDESPQKNKMGQTTLQFLQRLSIGNRWRPAASATTIATTTNKTTETGPIQLNRNESNLRHFPSCQSFGNIDRKNVLSGDCLERGQDENSSSSLPSLEPPKNPFTAQNELSAGGKTARSLSMITNDAHLQTLSMQTNHFPSPVHTQDFKQNPTSTFHMKFSRDAPGSLGGSPFTSLQPQVCKQAIHSGLSNPLPPLIMIPHVLTSTGYVPVLRPDGTTDAAVLNYPAMSNLSQQDKANADNQKRLGQTIDWPSLPDPIVIEPKEEPQTSPEESLDEGQDWELLPDESDGLTLTTGDQNDLSPGTSSDEAEQDRQGKKKWTLRCQLVSEAEAGSEVTDDDVMSE